MICGQDSQVRVPERIEYGPPGFQGPREGRSLVPARLTAHGGPLERGVPSPAIRFLVASLAGLSGALGFAASPPMSLDEMRQAVSGKGSAILDFRLEGVVCAADGRRGLIALQDEGATELLELPSLPKGIQKGNHIFIEASSCPVTRGTFALRLGTAPVVELDGRHPPLTRSGSVDLAAGMQPIRVEWFNGFAQFTLDIEYEGPGVTRQKIPASALWCREDGTSSYLPGLRYAEYDGSSWFNLPDFRLLEPKLRGTTPGFDPSVRKQAEQVALVFSGYLKLQESGTYTFHLSSDDGARIHLGAPSVSCGILPGEDPPRITHAGGKAGESGQWVAAPGVVSFASEADGALYLELIEASHPVPVMVLDPAGIDMKTIVHRRVQASGVRTSSGIVTIGAGDIAAVAEPAEKGAALRKASEIRRLGHEEAAKAQGVELQGVVTMANARSMVLQDDSGGVYIHYQCEATADCPKPGDLWKVEGITGAGDFSPVVFAQRASFLGRSVLPAPVRPTWEQLVSGSLDAEQVEVEGVVVDASDAEVKLLTRDGQVTVISDAIYPLPAVFSSPAERAALDGSVVRMRGVYASSWDATIGRVHPAQFELGNAMMSVEEFPPEDLFSAPAKKAAELLLFTSQSNALKRVVIRGQLLQAKPPLFLHSDGSVGIRIISRDNPALVPGDMVEAVGFPRLGGASPLLLESRIRKTGTAPLPAAVVVQPERLPDPRLDSTMIEIVATLLNDSVRNEERVLELQAGPIRFAAVVPRQNPVADRLVRDSVVKLSGVYVSSSSEQALASPDPFEIRVVRSSDIEILKLGPWWTTQRTIALILVLSGVIVIASVWVTLLRRTVARRSRQLALEIEERESVERQRAMEQERSRVAQDLHDELGAGLTEAGLLSSVAKNPGISQEMRDGYLDQLSGVCHDLVTGLDEIVWAVNPRYDSVADLAGYFSLFAQRFLALASIGMRMKIDSALPAHPLDSRKRHGIFLAFKEALNNIVRHSSAREVHLSIGVVDGELDISLSDDGQGFDPAVVAAGADGLAGMKNRIRQLGGSCIIESKKGAGTTVRFKISLERIPA